MTKLIYRIVMIFLILVSASALVYIGCQLKDGASQLKRLNDHIDFIRGEIPMSLLKP